MSAFYWSLAAIAGQAAILAAIGTYDRRRFARAMVVALFALAALTAAVGLLLQRGLPRPVALDALRASAEEATVQGVVLEPDRAIYLWLSLPGSEQPIALAAPWSEPLARQIVEAQAKAKKDGRAVKAKLKRLYEPTLDDQEPMFYPEPQPALPEKQEPNQPTEFQP